MTTSTSRRTPAEIHAPADEQRAALDHVTAYASATLRQSADFLQSITDELYTAKSPALLESTIGQHMRHTLDHYAAALGASADGAIDYDHRSRGTPIETDRSAALAMTGALLDRLASLHSSTSDAGAGEPSRRTARFMLSAKGDEIDIETTLEREIAFAAHHAIHHQSMMAIIARELGAEVSPGFGKAPSTLNFERRQS